ncbi:MAG: haloacid dehalogenase [Planctomycetes bacterium]|nr:haloacid dehalogenase [Planctomycetota bacterium]
MSAPTASLDVVFWDIDDTMFTTTAFARRARERAIAAMIERGLKATPEVVFAELAAVVEEFGSNDDRHYDRLLKRLPAEATAGTNPDLLVTAGVIAYHETKWEELRLAPGAARLLADLNAAGVRLGVISAGLTRKQMEKILRLGMDRYVEPQLILITDQVGVAKSNPLLYRMAVELAGVPAERTMHVGDHPQKDADGAKRAGMQVAWHRGTGKYSQIQPELEPDHIIDSLEELRPIFIERYGLALPPR